MYTIFKAFFYLSILTFGLISFTGSVSSAADNELFSLIELTKQGLRWTAKEDADSSKVGQQPCTYDLKLESKFKDLKEPIPLQRSFFDASNVDISVTAECPEIHLPKESLEDIRNLMLNYGDLTYTQRVVVDYRIKTGYYKPIVIEKTKLPYALTSRLAWRYGRIANLLILLNRIASLLFRKYMIGNRRTAVEL
ncbi:hypothetical protein MAM1_0506c10771 [Mucor ambiguus]|uniref:Uncharacterized protein n=1 Tax=Mucor ambiguus TaxID=91626 RepID=A0A0C9N576_9FUNG|nr:hypothetical protein MAM1_0506c10771 [Mucor ambiguus]